MARRRLGEPGRHRLQLVPLSAAYATLSGAMNLHSDFAWTSIG
jgi:hypothetical protein